LRRSLRDLQLLGDVLACHVPRPPQRGDLREVGARGRSLGLRSGDLFDQACSQRQEVLYSLGMISPGLTTFRLALSQAPEHVEGEE
jgi:hypothetical protein